MRVISDYDDYVNLYAFIKAMSRVAYAPLLFCTQFVIIIIM